MPRPSAVAAVLVAAALAALPSSAAALTAPFPIDTTVLLSGDATFGGPLPTPVEDGRAFDEAVSDDGTKVAFQSASDGLSTEDDDAVVNVYVKDLATGAVTLASRSTGAAGAPADDDCFGGAISGDGSAVAFTCSGPLRDASGDHDANDVADTYLRDLQTGETVLITRATGLAGAAVGGGSPSLSRDGEYVAFASNANGIGTTPDNPGGDVFRRQVGGGNATVVVSRGDDGPGNSFSYAPSISDSGARVAFETFADNLGDSPDDDVAQIYVRNVGSPTRTQLASRATGTTAGADSGAIANDDARSPALSGDGQTVVFQSEATNLDATDTDGETDVFKRTLSAPDATRQTTLVSRVPGGAKSNGSANDPVVSTDGTVVAWGSYASNLDPADTLGPVAPFDPDAVVADLTAGTVEVASGTDGRGAGEIKEFIAISGDGRVVVSTVERGDISPGSGAGTDDVLARDRIARTVARVDRPAGDAPYGSLGGEAEQPDITPDGHYAVFTTTAPGLGVTAPAQQGIVRRDLRTGATVLVSRADGPDGTPLRTAFLPSVSADGNRVAFVARDAGDVRAQVLVRDLAAGTTTLASRADGAGGAPGDRSSDDPQLSLDGTRVLFSSTATNLGDGDTDTDEDLHLRDLGTDRTLFPVQADGPPSATKTAYGADGRLSADGTLVAFSTDAVLAPPDTGTNTDVYVRDTAAQRTRLVSVDAAGGPADRSSARPFISADGTRVAFSSSSTDLLAAPVADTEVDTFVRDLGTGVTALAGRADGVDGGRATGGSTAAGLSGDGATVLFRSDGANLLPGALTENQYWARDTTAGTTRLVTRADGAAGALLGVRGLPAVDGAGACAVFDTRTPLAPGQRTDTTYVDVRALRAGCGGSDPAPPAGPGSGPTPGGGGSTPPPSTAPDRTAPRLSKVKLTRTRFRVGPKPTATTAAAHGAKPGPATAAAARGPKPGTATAAARRGTMLRLSVSEAARLTVAVQRVVPGRKVKRRCKAVKRRPRKAACAAWKTAGTLTRRYPRGGAKTVAFTGRIGRKALAPGRYRFALRAQDAAGNRSKLAIVTFRVVRR